MERLVPPTPTQYALFLCFLVFGPAMSAVAARLAHARARSASLAALLTLGASWGGWVVSCVCAAVMFPTYPRSGVPSEPWAMLFVLPGFAVGGVCLAWARGSGVRVRGDAGQEVRAGLAIASLAVVGAIGLVWLHVRVTTWPARRELPAGAIVLREDILVDSFIGDFDYTMEARMTREAFLEWMTALSLDCVREEGEIRCRSPDSSPSTQLVDLHGAYGTWSEGVGHFHAFST